MKEILVLAKWIEESMKTITDGRRKSDVKIILTEHEDFTPLVLAYKTVSGMQSAIYDHTPLTSTCANIGKLVCVAHEHEGMDEGERNIRRVNVGYHLLNTMFDKNKIKIRDGRSRRDAYTISVIDDEFIDNLLYSVNAEPLDLKLHSKVIFDEPLEYTKFNHPVLGEMVRKCNPDAKGYFKYETCPTVFDVINKHMKTPYVVNRALLNVLEDCKGDPLFTHQGERLNNEQLVGIRREQTAVFDLAAGIGTRVFYQGMFYDFRGRLYSSLIYFSPQGSKLSKNLFYLADKKPLGADGWFWLLVHAANTWGKDKLSLDDGYQYAEDHLDEWMVWASDPVNEKGWQDCDEDAIGFLATIMEIHNAMQLENKHDYESGLIVSWDATCSGLQVLSALTRDEMSGKLCNLTGEDRGDYYQMIADEVWKECDYTEEDERMAGLLDFDLKRLGEAIEGAENRERKKEAIEEMKCFMDENRDDIRIATKVFWGNPLIADLKRKIVKRPCMTYFYSCQPKTMSKQLYADFKSLAGFSGLHMSYCYWMCNKIYKACREHMPIATQVMDLLIDMGLADYREDKDFTITGPFNEFLLMQYYRNPLTKNVKMKYKKTTIRLKVIVGRGSKITYNKVKSATSPNVVHMLDSQIVASVVMNADYDINVIHDSFGTCPADAGALYEDCRTCFISLFDEGLLFRLLDEKGFESDIDLGNLNIEDINDYAFK